MLGVSRWPWLSPLIGRVACLRTSSHYTTCFARQNDYLAEGFLDIIKAFAQQVDFTNYDSEVAHASMRTLLNTANGKVFQGERGVHDPHGPGGGQEPRPRCPGGGAEEAEGQAQAGTGEASPLRRLERPRCLAPTLLRS